MREEAKGNQGGGRNKESIKSFYKMLVKRNLIVKNTKTQKNILHVDCGALE